MRKISIAAAAAALMLVGAGCSATVTPAAPAAQAPAPAPVVAKYKAGDKVEARWKGGLWYKGAIAAVNADGTYDINYDDGDKESNVTEAYVRLQAAAPAAGAAAFKAGDLIEAHWKGGQVWWKGKIAAVNADGTYNINFDDGDKESNVPAASVRARQ